MSIVEQLEWRAAEIEKRARVEASSLMSWTLNVPDVDELAEPCESGLLLKF